MPLAQEIYQSLYGAWRIACMDAGAMRYFNLTIDGFWRSFIAAVLLAPFFLITNIVNETGAGAQHLADNAVGYAIVWLVVWFVGWAVFPLIMVPVASLLNLSGTYVPFIIAWNWSSMLMAAVLYPLSFLFGLGVIGEGGAALLLMAARMSVFFYAYLVARTSLQCSLAVAVGIVLLEFLLGLLILGGANQLIYGGIDVPSG